jgi:hypothetical protein
MASKTITAEVRKQIGPVASLANGTTGIEAVNDSITGVKTHVYKDADGNVRKTAVLEAGAKFTSLQTTGNIDADGTTIDLNANGALNLTGASININSRNLLPETITLTANDQNADWTANSGYVTVITGNYINGSQDFPDATTLYVGWEKTVTNKSACFFHVYNSDNSKVFHIPPYSIVTFTCVDISSVAGDWYCTPIVVDPRNGVQLHTDYYNSTTDNANFQTRPYQNGGTVGIPPLYDNAIVQCTTSTTATNSSGIYSNASRFSLTNGPIMCRLGVSFGSLSDGTDNLKFNFGLVDDVTRASVTSEMVFVYDYASNGGVQSYFATTKDTGGTTTPVNLSSTPSIIGSSSTVNSGDILQLFVQEDFSSNIRADFWIGNTHKTSINTNITSTDRLFWHTQIEKTSGTATNHSMWIDSAGMQRTFKTPRW